MELRVKHMNVTLHSDYCVFVHDSYGADEHLISWFSVSWEPRGRLNFPLGLDRDCRTASGPRTKSGQSITSGPWLYALPSTKKGGKVVTNLILAPGSGHLWRRWRQFTRLARDSRQDPLGICGCSPRHLMIKRSIRLWCQELCSVSGNAYVPRLRSIHCGWFRSQ